MKAGATFYTDPSFDLTARFRDGPSSAGTFTTHEEIDSILATVTAGVDLLGSGGSSLRLFYEGDFGETTLSQGGGLSAEVRL